MNIFVPKKIANMFITHKLKSANMELLRIFVLSTLIAECSAKNRPCLLVVNSESGAGVRMQMAILGMHTCSFLQASFLCHYFFLIRTVPWPGLPTVWLQAIAMSCADQMDVVSCVRCHALFATQDIAGSHGTWVTSAQIAPIAHICKPHFCLAAYFPNTVESSTGTLIYIHIFSVYVFHLNSVAFALHNGQGNAVWIGKNGATNWICCIGCGCKWLAQRRHKPFCNEKQQLNRMK